MKVIPETIHISVPDEGYSRNNTTDRYDITEILLKVVLSTIKPTNQSCQFD
jgi:hypothetical protein